MYIHIYILNTHDKPKKQYNIPMTRVQRRSFMNPGCAPPPAAYHRFGMRSRRECETAARIL